MSETQPTSPAMDSGLVPRDAGLGNVPDAARVDAGAIGSPADAGGAGQPLCPPLGPADALPDFHSGGWSSPTQLPFSCAPMPSAFFFPRPDAGDAEVPGAYARCASFADARARSLAISPDGTRVVLLGTDGVGRVVDVASQLVVGVLAPPRASIDVAAFSPDGKTILSLARGEHLVTLWRADSFAPIWTVTVPGHSYQDTYVGAASFAPDGATTLISAGDTLVLLDAATGSIRARRSFATGPLPVVILTAGYAWNGQRIAVLSATVSGMCVSSPHGGTVNVLDPNTLETLSTPMTWPMDSGESPGPGQMWLATQGDLVLTVAGQTDPFGTVAKAFRVSDGSSLPVMLPALPLALSPEGASALVPGTRALEMVRVSDGTVLASTASDSSPVAAAVSADGTTVAVGSSGAGLLGIWRPATGPLVPTCTAEPRESEESNMLASLSADGATIAIDWGREARIVRRADGAVVSTIVHAQQELFGLLELSPDARYLLAEFAAPSASSDFPVDVFRTSDGAQVADLGGKYGFQGGSWNAFAFPSRGGHLDGVLQNGRQNAQVLDFDLAGGSASTRLTVAGWASMPGLSGDCPLIIGATGSLVRACGGCQPRPVANNTRSGIVSLDGASYLSFDASDATSGSEIVAGTTLWNVGGPTPGLLRTYPPRMEESGWNASEVPVAVSAHGDRAITTGDDVEPCSRAPGFTSRVHDVASDVVIDELPPGITSASADLNVVGFGPVLWCAR